MTHQYPLPLPHREAMGADDFMITASNREAVAWIDQWPAWPGHCIAIFGPAGSGKTHLAHVWQSRARAAFVTVDDLLVRDAALLAGANRHIVFDGAQSVAGHAKHEQNLLHLYNLLREQKGFLLLTGLDASAQWKIDLPDLRSRLSSVPVAELRAPSDELISALLVKQFRDRQIDIGAEVIDFLLPRMTRTPGAIRDLVTALDRASLAENKKVTTALARRVLESAI